ncbi:LysM peptidoglycan-binding domain-containing protein [Phenylobacterium sp.]|uniref:LysM peptidoglycan-binding domain-containing protein n=1 Tax=Phenylobacterium sp. TaxID=1871053 RepID=UPI0035AD9313
MIHRQAPQRLSRMCAAPSAALLLMLGLSACTNLPTPKPHASKPAPLKPTPGLSVQQRIGKAVELLGQGEAPQARVELVQALADEPGQPAARNLLGQIDVDPKTLLGDKSYAYTVKQGDTLYSLADRLLGDKLKFYGLARYNGMDKPEELAVGRVLQIPGVEKKAAPPPPPPPPPRKPAPAPAPAQPVKPPPASPADQARARQLRATALRNMNSGAIDAAVDLLREALQLDPGSHPIQNDLVRALRIQATLRARP